MWFPSTIDRFVSCVVTGELRLSYAAVMELRSFRHITFHPPPLVTMTGIVRYVYRQVYLQAGVFAWWRLGFVVTSIGTLTTKLLYV